MSEQIRITLDDDTTDEPDETFLVQLGGAVNASFATSSNTVTIEDNDDPPTISIAADVQQRENLGTVVLEVNLSEVSEKQVRFRWRQVSRSTDTATAADLFDPSVVEVQDEVIDPGTTTGGAIRTYIKDDTLDEDNETFTLEIHAFQNATAGAKTEATVTIEDDDEPPVVSVAAASADEGDPVEFHVELSAMSGKTVTVRAATSVGSGDTAAASDFTAVSETVTFIPGSELEVVSVATDGDTLDEPNETFTVTLSGPTNATLSTTDTTAKGTIVDDDPAPVVTLVLTPSSISENGGSTRVTATLSNPSSEATTVTVSAVAASPAVAGDFDLSTNRTLTIAAGSTTSTGTVTIAANDNNVDARNRMVTVSATATNTQDVAGNPDDETLTIEDDEATPAVTLSLSASPIGENGGTTVATASLSGPSSEATTVTLTAAPGDWTADGGDRLTIPAGATQSDGSVTLTAVNDATDAPNKVLTVTASAANALGVNQPAGVALEITDDEAAPTATLAVSAPTIGENGGEATVSVKLDHPSSEATTLTVTAAVADPKAAEFTLSGAVLTVPAGDMAGSSTATLTATNNETDAPDQTVTVMARAENTQGIAGDPADVSLTITNDEASPTVTLILSPLTIGEAGETATVTAALSHPSSEATTVVVRVEPEPPALTVVLTQSGSALTIAAGETTSIGTRTVTAVPNDVDAPHRRVTVSAAADNKQGLAGHPADVTLTISDDDERGFVFSPEARTISDGEVVENAYTVALTSEPTATVTVTVTSGSGDLALSDETFSPILDEWDLTFTPDNWDVPQALSLVAGDDADSVTDTVVLRHAALGGDYQDFNRDYTVTITDTDAPTRNIVLSVDRSEVSEGAGAQPLRVRARLDGAALTAAATVAVAVGTGTAETSTDFAAAPARFNLTIAPGEFAASRSVTLTPVADALVEGDETVTVSGTTTATQEGTTTLLEVTGAQVTIADDDARGVTVAADDPLGVDEAGSATYTVVLDSEPTGEVTVTPEVTGDPDVTVAPAVLIFTASTWHVAQGVTVSAADDDDTVDDTATVTHAVAGADYGSNRVTAASVAVSVGDDDALGVTVSTGRLTVPEGESMTYTVVLASAPSVTVTVRPTVSGDPDVTVAPSRLTFTAGNWDAEQPVTVTARADADSEDDTATVSHAVTGVAGLTARAVAVLVIDDDEASTGIMLRLSPETVPERGAHTVTVTASLNGAALTSDTDVSVQVRAGTGAGVASATDFAAVPAALVLTIRAGETEARGTFRLTPVDDALDEGDGETVEVTGSATVSGTLAISVNALTIVDDDGRGLEVSRTALTVTEASSATYTVRLASLPTGPVAVAVSVADNSDVTARPESLEFSVANWETEKTVTVSAADDPDGDAETATVTHAATGGGYDGITGSAVAVAVRDNDRASRTVQLAVEPETVEEDGGAASLTVTATLDGAARATETEVALAATGGTATSGEDFQALTGLSVTIPANETQGSATVTFSPVDDALDEGLSETVVLGGTADGLTVRTATLTIADDDGRGIELPEGPVALGEESDATYRVALSTEPTGEVTVRVTVSGNRDVTVDPTSLTFTADTWDTEQTVTVLAAHDDDAANDEAELRHAASGADYARVTALPLAVAVTDDDTRGVAVSETELEFREGSEATYEVVLDTQPTGTVTVTPSLATGSDADVTVSPPSLRFTTSSWSRAQPVTVHAGQDLDQDADAATVEHAVTGADYGEESVTAAGVDVTVTDDDVPSTTINLSVAPETVREGARPVRLTVTAELDASPEAEDTVLTLSLQGGTAQVSDPAAPGDDFATDDATLTIVAGQSNATAQVTLAPVGDDVDEDDETVRVAVTPETVRAGLALSSTSLEVTIEDDDTRGVTLSRSALSLREEGSATYTVRLDSQPTGPVTVRPSVTPAVAGDTDLTVDPEELTFTADDWREAQTVTVTAADDADGDDDAWTLAHAVSGADYGGVTLEDVPVLVSDNDQASRTVTLSVDPVEVQESDRGERVTVTAELDGAARSVETVVALEVTGGTAEAGTDFDDIAGETVTIPPGSASSTVTFFLQVENDDIDEGDGETVRLGGSAEGLTVRAAELTIVDDDERGIVVSGAPVTLVTEEGSTDYTVRLASAPTGPVTVRVTVSRSRDVTVQPSSLAFTADTWDTEQTVTVRAAHDDDASHDMAELRHAAAGADYRGVTGDAVQVIVADNDQPGLTVTPEVLSIREGSEATYTVVLNTQPTGTVTVSAAAGSAEGVTVSPSRLAFSPSNWARPQTVTVTVEDDGCPGRCDKIFLVEHTIVSHDADYDVHGSSLTVEVTASDTPSTKVTLAVSPQTVREGAGATSLTVTAELDGAATTTDTVLTLSATSTQADFEVVDDVTLTIPAGTVRATTRMTLTPADDDIDGPNETRTVRVTGSSPQFSSVTEAEVTIADDDTRALVVSPRAVRIGRNGEATYTVRLATRPSGGDVQVQAMLHAPPGVTVAPDAFLRFTAASWSDPQTVTVAVAPGTAYRAGETAAVVYTATGADYRSVAGGEVVVTLTHRAPSRPSPPVPSGPRVTLAVSPSEVPEGAGAAEVTVTAVLEAALETATAIAVAVSGGTAEAGADFAPVAGFTVTVPAGATQGSATFELVPVDDAVDEGAGETVTVAGTAPGLAVEPATLTIADDDDTPVTLAVSPAEVREDGGSAKVRVSATLGAAAPEPVALTLRLADGTAAAGADFVPLGPVTLTIAPGSTSGAVTVTVTPVDDAVDEGAVGETVTVTGSAAGFDVAPATLTLLDDDEAPAADARSPSTVLGLSVALVAGPAVVSVEDAWVQEGAGAQLDFAVRLSRARDAETRVEWATVDGTARAGADYEAASDTVVFAPGETSATVSVAVRDDAHDEGEETLEVVLSNPVGARLGDARATGTISNTGHIPRAWLARFGRTAAEQVLGAVQGRFAAARAPGTEVRLVGQPVGAADAQAREAQARRAARARRGEAGWDGVQGLESREVTGRDFLSGSSFALTTGTEAGGFASVWGRGAVSRFDAREGERTLDGEVSGALLGVDWRVGRGTAGLMLSLSRGAGEYAKGDDCTQESCAGEVSSTLTGLYPYGRYAVSERVTVWGVAGYGTGMLRLEPQGEAPMEADTDLALGALGVRSVLVQAPGGDGIELAVVSDGLLVRTSSEAVPGLAAAAGDVMRLRLGVEGTWRGLEAGGARVVPSLELGVRHDGGDAETGFGADIGAGLAWSDATRGIEARLGGRALLAHEDSGLRERGFSASLAWDPTPGSDRGVRLTLAQTMGAQATGGADALLARTTMAGLAANDEGEAPGRRLEAALGYGFPVFAGRFTGTPEVGVALSQAERSYRLGWRLGLAGDGRVSLGLKLEGTRREPADGAPEHAVALRLNARW